MASLNCDDVGEKQFGLITRDSKANASESSRRRVDRGVNADHLSRAIDQRASRVALIDCGVGLDEIPVNRAFNHKRLALCRNDSSAYRQVEPERTSDGYHLVGDLCPVGVPEWCYSERRPRFNLEQRQVHRGIELDDGCGIVLCLGLSDNSHHHGVVTANDVIVGKDISVAMDNEPGPHRF